MWPFDISAMMISRQDNETLIDDYKWVVTQILDTIFLTIHDRTETLQAIKDLREFEDRILELEGKK